jgi:hypothetical protein
MANIWDGTHMFIWQPWEVLGGDVTAMIAKLKELAVTGVILKYSDGNLVGDPVSQRFMSEFKRLAPLFKKEGLTVGGWSYMYLTDVDGEVDALRQAVEAGADWIVLDAEKDVAGKNALVTQYGQKVRALFPNLKIGLSSYAIADYHKEVPFNEYAAFVDVMMPQVYWSTMGWDVEVAFNASVASYKKYGKPIAPTGQAYDAATSADMARFVQLCKQAGFTHVSWWDMQHCTDDHYAGIKANLILPPVSAPSITPATLSPKAVAFNDLPADVPADAWFAKSVAYVIREGIMGVDANGNFNPDQPVTRAMLAQALYNMYHQKA